MTIPLRTLLIATNNSGKVAELRQMLAGLPLGLVSLSDLPPIPDVEETGVTFDENARLKAREYARLTGLYSLADDSGLEVEALGDRPGVLSARYGGPATSFEQKIGNLLAEIDQTGDRERRARFVCSIAVANTAGEIVHTAMGVCPGRLSSGPRGSGGFGYDPIFIPDGHDLTFGELSENVKLKISHRAHAFEQIIPFLRDYNGN